MMTQNPTVITVERHNSKRRCDS